VQARSSNQRVAITIRKRRRAMNLSQEDLADRCDIHRTYIGAIERAEGNITLDTLDKIARALKIPSHELLR
jgi:transcriptional regulator with XRE-family HTH domain